MKFLSKDFEELLDKDPEMKEWLYQEICDKVVLKYQDKIGIDDVEVELVWDPQWDRDMMTEEAKLQLGML